MDKRMSTLISARRIAIAAAGAAMLLTNAFPAFAEKTESGTSTGRDESAHQDNSAHQDESSCERIADLATKMQGRLDDGRSKLQARRDDRDAKLTANRADWEAKLAARREKWESDFHDLIVRLEGDAATGTPAIAAYQAAMGAAWKARNASIDAANKAFRDGLDKLVTDKKTAVLNASLAFKASVSVAFAKAESDCASGAKPAKLLTDLRPALKAAQDKFLNDRKTIDKLGTKVGDLAKARQGQIEKAIADFKAAAEKARAAFKATHSPTASATGTSETHGDKGNLDDSATGVHE